MSSPPLAEVPEVDATPESADVSRLRDWWSRHREVTVVTVVLGLITWPPIQRTTVGLDPS